jgi:hypothetical protein
LSEGRTGPTAAEFTTESAESTETITPALKKEDFILKFEGRKREESRT